VQTLSSRDGVAAFFGSLGYDTDTRLPQTAAAMGVTAESLQRQIKHIERIAVQDEGAEPLGVYLVELASVTVVVTQGLARALRNRAGNYLLVLTDDYERLDFVLLERVLPPSPTTAITARQVSVRPRILTVNRRNPTPVQLRVLRRFTYTEADADAQYDKLLSAYTVAEWSEPLFNNRALFSDYYLNERLPERPEWRERPEVAYHRLQDLLSSARQRLSGQPSATTRQLLVEHALEALGFQATPSQAKADGNAPHYQLYASESPDKPVAVCLAYTWNRNLDGRDETRDTETADENPGARVVALLDSGEAPWAIVTNGKLWRLYSARAHSRATNYYEIDLDETLAMGDPNVAFRYFWLLFRAEAFVPHEVVRDGQARSLSFLDELVEESESYAKGLGERLKERVFEEIFPHFAAGFIEHLKAQPPITGVQQGVLLPVAQQLALKQEPDEEFRRQVFQGTLTFLYRLLFLLYAESRALLPVKEVRGYWEHSLTRLKEEVATKAGGILDEAPARLRKAYSTDSTALYDRLLKLFAVIDQGSRDLNVPLYNGGLFLTRPDPGDHSAEAESARFLLQHKIPDRYLALGLDRLARDIDEKRQSLVFVDYKSMGVRQLGSIYEGLLEFKIRVAPEKMAVVQGKKTEEVIPYREAAKTKRKILTKGRGRNAEERIYLPGDVYLENDRRERKATGSYYTPDHIVKYIVEHTVGPVLGEKFEKLRPKFRETQQAYRKALQRAKAFRKQEMKPDDPAKVANTYRHLVDELFDLRVMDPAMGSGHFLVEAVDFICDRILGQRDGFLQAFPWNPVTAFLDETRRAILTEMERQGISIDAGRLTDINLLKRHVLKRCIYGVDLNPMAVELAKVSLWLDCFTLGAPLSFLDHHLKCGNSLIGTTVQEVEAELAAQKKGHVADLFGGPFQGLLSATAMIEELRRIPDATIEQAERSRDLFKDFEKSQEPYKRALDIWVSRHFGNARAQEYLTGVGRDFVVEIRSDGANLSPEYQEVIKKGAALSDDKRFFHWDLEFPEAFVDLERKTWKSQEEQGFDAVIGNPPYVSSYSRHSQKGKTGEESFFLNTFKDQLGGRVNTFLVFLVATARYLRSDAYWAMIIPDTIVHNESYEATRRYLAANLHLAQVLKFRYSVFEDSTVGSSVLVIQRAKPTFMRLIEVGQPDEMEQRRFSLDVTVEPEVVLQSTGARFPFASKAALTFIRRMYQNSMPLGSLCEIRDGVNPGPKDFRMRILDPSGPPKATWRKLLEGENVQRYRIIEPTRLIDYDQKLLTPGLKKQGASLRESWIFNPNKIVSRQTADRLIAAFDESDAVGINSVHFTRLKDGSPYSIWFILACLNSAILNRFYQLEFQETRSTFPQVHISTLRQLPIPDIGDALAKVESDISWVGVLADQFGSAENTDFKRVLDCISELPNESRLRIIHDIVATLAARRARTEVHTDDLEHWIDTLLAQLYGVDPVISG